MPPRPLRISPSSLFRTHATLRTRIPLRSISIPAIQQQSPKLKLASKLRPNLNLPQTKLNIIPSRPFSSTPTTHSPAPSTTSGKSQADQIVEELQELYETATDELEIATESTDSATIYAASDRESARDALTSLLVAYELYTSSELRPEAETGAGQAEAEAEVSEEEKGRVVELSFDPAELEESVKEEVRRRVGQRVREVKSAVEGLEGRVHD
ncbi:hypothetical protein BJX76DRAFT_340514 [Aspergillus varians]